MTTTTTTNTTMTLAPLLLPPFTEPHDSAVGPFHDVAAEADDDPIETPLFLDAVHPVWLDEIVARDLAARDIAPSRVLPTSRPGHDEAQGGDGSTERVLRPEVWNESWWFTMPFDKSPHGPSYHRFRCKLHRLSGSVCHQMVDAPGTYAFTVAGPLIKHLRDHHGIVEPKRPSRRWAYGLVDDVRCSSATCLDCCVGPCCFVGRLLRVAPLTSDALTTDDGHVDSFRDQAVGLRPTDCGKTCCAYVGWAAVVLLLPPMLCAPCWNAPHHELRAAVIRAHSIDEHSCVTCAISNCCAPCSLLQVHREVASAGVWPGLALFDRAEAARPSPDDVLCGFRPLTYASVVCSRDWSRARALAPLITTAHVIE